MEKNTLSSRSHWDNVHKKNSFNFSFFSALFSGIQHYEFYDTVRRYMKPEFWNVFEVGCAPGNYLVQFYKQFSLTPAGIEYSKEGIEAIEKNFSLNGLDHSHIVFGDFFDDTLLAQHKNSYDVVFSIGFIEHFDDPASVVKRHMDLVSPGGIAVIAIPNIVGINKTFTSQPVLDIHNLTIMNIDAMKKLAAPYTVLHLDYSGGLFNIGLFFSKNRILETIRFLLFVFQRVIIDPIFILLYKIGFRPHCSQSSPQIVMILSKE